MVNARMGELRPDTWLRPGNLPAPAGVDSAIVVGGPISGAQPADLVGRLWNLDAMGTRSAELLVELGACAEVLTSQGTEALRQTVLISAAVVRFLRAEPLLPRRLSPPGWPVDSLRDRYADFDRAFGRVLGDALADQPP